MLKPFHPCNRSGCGILTRERWCDKHKGTEKARHRAHDKTRLSSSERGYGHEWRQARETYLDENPLCVRCEAKGKVKAAYCVDHIIPHKLNMELFWDSKSNWQSLCESCHNQKTRLEDGGFKR